MEGNHEVGSSRKSTELEEKLHRDGLSMSKAECMTYKIKTESNRWEEGEQKKRGKKKEEEVEELGA